MAKLAALFIRVFALGLEWLSPETLPKIGWAATLALSFKSISSETDHKPLFPPFTKHSLADTPPRIQRLRMRLMRFHIKELVHIKTFCQEGWPDEFQLNDAIKPYWTEREQLTIVQGILMMSNCIVIPSALKLEVLDRIHEGHQEFAQFTKEWGIKHSTSSPRYPQANGEVERAVRTVKSILKKENDPTKALLTYRSTPLASGHSAELLVGRKPRTTISTSPRQLKPRWPDLEEFCTTKTKRKQQSKLDHDRRHETKTKPTLVTRLYSLHQRHGYDRNSHGRSGNS
ncbi:Uncharacterized protein K02A2.6 [Exaiptasia diaphana]|nr:Uncharacterized protein K02A2.6 [Exaiptasia diaphana]